jgi:hypothetical protein
MWRGGQTAVGPVHAIVIAGDAVTMAPSASEVDLFMLIK